MLVPQGTFWHCSDVMKPLPKVGDALGHIMEHRLNNLLCQKHGTKTRAVTRLSPALYPMCRSCRFKWGHLNPHMREMVRVHEIGVVQHLIFQDLGSAELKIISLRQS